VVTARRGRAPDVPWPHLTGGRRLVLGAAACVVAVLAAIWAAHLWEDLAHHGAGFWEIHRAGSALVGRMRVQAVHHGDLLLRAIAADLLLIVSLGTTGALFIGAIAQAVPVRARAVASRRRARKGVLVAIAAWSCSFGALLAFAGQVALLDVALDLRRGAGAVPEADYLVEVPGILMFLALLVALGACAIGVGVRERADVGVA
jgi:hypothetical protein